MSRLRNVHTDVIVSVADHKVGRFGSDWVPADAPPDVDVAPASEAAPAAPAKKPAAKK